MKIIIPLAGYGKRLRPHTYTKPKPLIDVAGKPALGHLIDKLDVIKGSITEYIFITGYLGEQIAEYVDSNYDIPARYIEQTELLGQSHAIALAKDYVGDEAVFVIFVDTLFETDLTLVEKTDADGMIFVHEVDDPRRFGVVMLNDDQHIVKIVEKAEEPPSNLAVVGMYYFKSGKRLMDAFDWQISNEKMTKGEYYIADALQYMIDDGAKLTTGTVSVWMDVGVPAAVLATNRYLLRDGGKDNVDEIKDKFPNAIIVPPVNIHPTAQLENAVIGPDVTVSAGCVVRQSIIRNSIIGVNSTIEDALLDGSLIGRDAFVGGRYRAYNVGDSSSVGFAEIVTNA